MTRIALLGIALLAAGGCGPSRQVSNRAKLDCPRQQAAVVTNGSTMEVDVYVNGRLSGNVPPRGRQEFDVPDSAQVTTAYPRDRGRALAIPDAHVVQVHYFCR